MENIVLNITIGQRKKSEAFLDFYKKQGIALSLGTYGHGTASKETLDMLNIGSTEKCLIFSFMTMDKSKELLRLLEKEMALKTVGVGLSFTVPISAIDSMKNLKYLINNYDESKESEGYIVETENELVVVVANRGYTEDVMEIAREGGATGGTVVHARGTGQESSERFFGTLIGAEKEMIFIVTKTETGRSIIKAIKEKAGVDTKAGAMCFSLPVNDVAGLYTE